MLSNMTIVDNDRVIGYIDRNVEYIVYL